jgi:hypothetical protein
VRPCVLIALFLVTTGGAGDALAAGEVVRFHRAAHAYGGESFPDIRSDGRRYAVWIAQGYHVNLLGPLRSANPATLPLLYKEALFADERSEHPATHRLNPGGVTYEEVERQHPEWMLRDTYGAPIHSTRYGGYVLMDVGNPGYQQAWAANVIEQATRDGWAGVFADDLALALHGTTVLPSQYAAPADWQAAARSFLEEAGRRVRDAGLLFVTNTASGVSYLSVRHSWLQLVDGTMEEGWMRPSVSSSAPLAHAPGDWNRQLQELLDAEAQRRLFLAELPAAAGERRAIRFALTTFLLGANGSSSFGVAGRPEYTRPLWFPDFDDALALGRPLGPARPDGNSVWHRAFQHGNVIVNPTRVTRTAATAARGPAIRLARQTGAIVLRGELVRRRRGPGRTLGRSRYRLR